MTLTFANGEVRQIASDSTTYHARGFYVAGYDAGDEIIPAQLTLQDSLIHDTEGEGVIIASSANGEIERNMFSATSIPIEVTYQNYFPLIRDNVFSGNGFDAVSVGGTMNVSGTWYDPYHYPQLASTERCASSASTKSVAR